SAYWLNKARTVCDTHLIKKVNERSLLVQRTRPIKVEVVVRGYLAGSMARAYEAGVREFCGQPLPDELLLFQKLDKPIITPTTKAPVGDHDEPVTEEQIIERNICSLDQWLTVCRYSHALFSLGQKTFAQLGWLLVDTKY